MAAASYTEQFRTQQKETADSRGQDKSKDFWKPEKTHKTRLLPPKETMQTKVIDGEEKEVITPFYGILPFHFLPGVGNGKGKFIATPHTFDNGKRCPIDVLANDLWNSGDKNLKDHYGKIKRKHQYIFNLLLFTPQEGGEELIELKLCKDVHNDGKLIKVICKMMGMAFVKDFDSNAVDKYVNGKVEDDDEIFDLLDEENGHDLKLKKEITGDKPWNVSYAKSSAIGEPRALTKQEREIADARIDLQTYGVEDLVTDYNEAKKWADAYAALIDGNVSAPAAQPSAAADSSSGEVDEAAVLAEMEKMQG